MKVQDLMTKDAVSVRPDQTVGEVALLMCKHDISGLPVVDADKKVLGLITEEDLVTEDMRVHGPAFIAFLGEVIEIESTGDLDEQMKKIAATKAQDLMDEKFETVTPEDGVDVAAGKIVRQHANPLPVVDSENKLVGIISRADLISILSCGEKK